MTWPVQILAFLAFMLGGGIVAWGGRRRAKEQHRRASQAVVTSKELCARLQELGAGGRTDQETLTEAKLAAVRLTLELVELAASVKKFS